MPELGEKGLDGLGVDLDPTETAVSVRSSSPLSDPAVEPLGAELIPSENTLSAQTPQVPEKVERARLLVLGPETVVTYPLPNVGSVSIGRSSAADVCIEDGSISRMHAVLTVREPSKGDSGLTIRDLGSSNGTVLRGQRIETGVDHSLNPGEIMEIGQSTLLVKRGKMSGRVRRLCSHGYFELRLEEECERAKGSKTPFTILRLRVQGEVQSPAVEEALTAFLSSEDLIAIYAPHEYEILLAHSDAVQAQQACDGLRFGLGRLGAKVQIGLASYPRDGQVPEALVASAGAAIRGGSSISEILSSKENLVVEHPAMRSLYDLIRRIAPSDISVLILGETGVGKEVAAKAIHAASRKPHALFLPINCGALPEPLLESELFGHERGAFTGAVKMKPGLLETAIGGTVFLDEIAEMPLATQVKLLRVIEERSVRRVGGLEARPIDVRFVAATNRDLEREVQQGNFREDLFYRLNGITLSIPPLRERPSEIPLLAHRFAHECRTREGRPGDVSFTQDALQLILKYAWPGNVRELRNIIERAVVLAGDRRIGLEHLPVDKLSSSVIWSPTALLSRDSRTGMGGVQDANTLSDTSISAVLEASDLTTAERATLGQELENLERKRILDALESCGGNQTRAAQALGMSRKRLINRLDRYGIARPRKGNA